MRFLPTALFITLFLLFGFPLSETIQAERGRPVLRNYKDLMGRKRAFIEESEPLMAGRTPTPEEGHRGWVRYGDDLIIRYSASGKAVRLRGHAPEHKSCVDTIRWAGFKKAQPPIKGMLGRCDWPGYSERNGTGSKISARLDQGIIDLWYSWKKKK